MRLEEAALRDRIRGSVVADIEASSTLRHLPTDFKGQTIELFSDYLEQVSTLCRGRLRRLEPLFASTGKGSGVDYRFPDHIRAIKKQLTEMGREVGIFRRYTNLGVTGVLKSSFEFISSSVATRAEWEIIKKRRASTVVGRSLGQQRRTLNYDPTNPDFKSAYRKITPAIQG